MLEHAHMSSNVREGVIRHVCRCCWTTLCGDWLALLLTASVPAAVYNSAESFSLTSNPGPGSTFAYGYLSSNGGAFSNSAFVVMNSHGGFVTFPDVVPPGDPRHGGAGVAGWTRA